MSSNKQIELKDVLHLYTGCKLNTGTGTVLLAAVQKEIVPCTDFRVIVLNGNELYESKADVKPILRPLSDMTKKEMEECGNMVYDFSDEPKLNRWRWEDFDLLLCSVQFLWLLKNGFDLFDLIPSGQAIDKTTIK